MSLAVSSFTARRAAAAVAVVVVLFVSSIVARAAIESGAPDELDLLSFPFVASELSFRIFGEASDDPDAPIASLSTELVAAGLLTAVVAGVLVAWLRYRRIEATR